MSTTPRLSTHDGILTEAQREALLAEMSRYGAQLNEDELPWREKQPFLESRGYMLRPRYRAGWVPSWLDGSIMPYEAEDIHPIVLVNNVIDATRMADGKQVFIKRITASGKEARIAQIFSQDSIRHDPKNHCVPVYEVFQDDVDEDIAYLVMPLLRRFDDPEFYLVNDIVELADQLFEGLVFMHAQGVAHRDCTYQNIMMDATSIYPEGFHPHLQDSKPDANGLARAIRRYFAPRPVKYLFIDFGISSHFLPGQERLVLGLASLDKTVPELSSDVPYDPFKVDIYVLGNVFKKTRLSAQQKYANVEFLKDLVDSMTARDPSSRPDSVTVLKRWRRARRSIGRFQRATVLVPRNAKIQHRPESKTQMVLRLTPTVVKRELRLAKQRLPFTTSSRMP